MSGPENTFIASVHKHMPPVNEFYRMKNHNQYNGGIADMWYSGEKADLWIEYKFIVVPKRDDTIIDLMNGGGKAGPILSHLQQAWLEDRYIENRNVAVIVGCKEGGVLFENLDWKHPYTAKQFRNLIETRQELATVITHRCL